MSAPNGPGRLVFTARPAPVSARLRPGRRVALLLEMVDKCRGGKATLLQLHALDSALVNRDARSVLAGDEDARLERAPLLRIDPALNRAVDRALGDGLLQLQSGGAVALTGAGKEALELVRAAGVLMAERGLLAEIEGKLTQTRVKTATRLNA